MSRVWKRFFTKISKGFAVFGYLIGSLTIPEFAVQYFGGPEMMGAFGGLVVFIVLPMILFMLWDTYKDAKSEVERENRDLMRTLGGKF
jgi:L-lactate permease